MYRPASVDFCQSSKYGIYLYKSQSRCCMKKLFLLLVILVGCAHVKSGKKPSQSDKQLPTWVVESDAIASEFTRALGERYPENASTLGFNEFDSKGMLFDNTNEEKDRAF